MVQALLVEQTMTMPEIEAELGFGAGYFTLTLKGRNQPGGADRITAILRDLRHPFDDPCLVRQEATVKESGWARTRRMKDGA